MSQMCKKNLNRDDVRFAGETSPIVLNSNLSLAGNCGAMVFHGEFDKRHLRVWAKAFACLVKVRVVAAHSSLLLSLPSSPLVNC